jgi:hypothetical protein
LHIAVDYPIKSFHLIHSHVIVEIASLIYLSAKMPTKRKCLQECFSVKIAQHNSTQCCNVVSGEIVIYLNSSNAFDCIHEAIIKAEILFSSSPQFGIFTLGMLCGGRNARSMLYLLFRKDDFSIHCLIHFLYLLIHGVEYKGERARDIKRACSCNKL